MTTDCAFPFCREQAETDREMCLTHHKVTVASSGSWVADKHTASEGRDD